jgi:signal transduction histidine kinase
MSKQQIHWLPLYKLPLFRTLVEGMLQDTKDMYPLFLKAKDQPWVMDDATIQRAIRLYNERLGMMTEHLEQIARWRKEGLLLSQREMLDRLEQATKETQELSEEILELARAIEPQTIDQILAKDPEELALNVLSGKLKTPSS